VLFGFITSWVFGREYSDHTAKDLLALPVSRSSIVSAKFMMIAIWCVFLTFVIFAFEILAGVAVQMPGLTHELFFSQRPCIHRRVFTHIITVHSGSFFASLGRGYLAPIGFVPLAGGAGADSAQLGG
jgi:ABC-2 type transport system permease protein